MRYSYRYANQLPLRGGCDARLVNWVVTHEETGEVLYKNAFISDFEILETTVEAIARDGRARWKIENGITLAGCARETKGYHLEHNFGHGELFLSSLLLSLNLLAFLFHTVMGLLDEKYRLLRQA